MDRAAYAADPARSAGRLIPEPASPTRTDFQRDRDRIIHSTAFRRLAHKTQVFVPHEGDHYRTRLTHSIEVGQLARALARSLHLDEDLAETCALAHDLGHTPFGHTGEEVLDTLMAGAGGFDHNAQTLRIVTKLENRYAAFDGLNLTFETIEGLAKHNGPVLGRGGAPAEAYAARGLPGIFRDVDAEFGATVGALGLDRYASAEAQCAAIADDIAYNAHDLDDGLRAGLFTLDACRPVPFLAALLDEIADAHPGLDENRTIHELSRRVITQLVEDVVRESRARLDGVATIEGVREAGRPVLSFSAGVATSERETKALLFAHMYRHPEIVGIRERAGSVVRDLFFMFRERPERMAREWAAQTRRDADDGLDDRAGRQERLVCDYIAGMTDRFAMAEHRRYFSATPELRYRRGHT